MFKELFSEGLENKGKGFKNSMRLHYGDVEKFLGKGSGFSKYNDNGIWTISDNQDNHVMTYNMKTGELYTDKSISDVETMIKRGK